MPEQVDASAWELEQGLIDDADGIIRNPHFGVKDEYAAAVMSSGGETPVMFLIDLEDEDSGTIIATQGFTIGKGWEIVEDGAAITHPVRNNVVDVTQYGQLQARVCGELGVEMQKYGSPLVAETWEGLKFHWMQEEHKVVGTTKQGKNTATGLMPTEFYGKVGEEEESAPKKAPASKKTSAPKKSAGPSDLEEKLAKMAAVMDKKDFQKQAMATEGVVKDEKLMNSILDDGDTGFWATHQE